MNNKTSWHNKVFFIGFVALWSVLIIGNLIAPKKTFSENENKVLATLPDFSVQTLLNGKFMQQVDDCVNDHFLLRDQWISTQSLAEYSLGKREINNVFIGRNSLLNKLPKPNEKLVQTNLNGMKKFQSNFNGTSYFMLVPSNSGVLQDKLPSFAVTNHEKEMIEEISNQATNLVNVPVYDTLYDHRNEYIFYRTDHHWTTYGAYLAYQQFCEAAGLVPAGFNATNVAEDFNGTLYSRSGVRFVDSDAMQAFQTSSAATCRVYDGKKATTYPSIYFEEFLDKKDKYSYFLGQNQPLVTLYGGKPTGKRILLFKDSYAHCLAPMLLEHYEEVTLIDLRYINDLGHLVKIDDYTDALFLYSIDVFTSQMNAGKLESSMM